MTKSGISRFTWSRSSSGKKFGSSSSMSWSELGGLVSFHCQASWSVYHVLPSLVSAYSIQSITLQRPEHSKHRIPRRFCVAQNVAALLSIDASDAVPGFRSVDLLVGMWLPRGPTTYRRLPDKRSAIGAAGSMIVSHVLITSTSRMALRETFLRFDFEPRVATSLRSERLAVEVMSLG